MYYQCLTVHGSWFKTFPPNKNVLKDVVVAGQPFEKLYESAYHIRHLKAGQQHVLKSEYKLFSSDRRYRIPRFNKVRLKHSFVHQSILKLKMELNQRPNLP